MMNKNIEKFIIKYICAIHQVKQRKYNIALNYQLLPDKREIWRLHGINYNTLNPLSILLEGRKTKTHNKTYDLGLRFDLTHENFIIFEHVIAFGENGGADNYYVQGQAKRLAIQYKDPNTMIMFNIALQFSNLFFNKNFAIKQDEYIDFVKSQYLICNY